MFRTLLQELSQQRGWASPAYTYDCEGPSHMPRFYATVAVNGAQFWADEGAKTVKEAKELAAKVALEHLSALLPPPQQKPELVLEDPKSLAAGSQTSVEEPKLTLTHGCPPPNNKRQRNSTPALVLGVFRPLLSPIVTPANLEPPPFRELLELCSKNGYFLETNFTDREKIEATLLVQLKEKLIVRQSCGKSKKDAKAHAASKLLGDLEKEGLLISKNAGRMQQLQNQHGGTASRCNNMFDVMDTQPPTPTSGKKSDASKIIGSLDKPETQHIYKSRLQTYAQKIHNVLPLYHTSQIGSPQAILFKSTLSIDGRTFESPQEYHTAKEAKFGAAKVAMLSLEAEFGAAKVTLLSLPQESKPQKKIKAGSTSGVSFSGIHVNYKSTLQTYAQKNSKQLPSYSKIQYGPPHAPQFKSIVTIDGKPFESPQYYRTSKEAESAAAYAAIMSLTQEA